MQLKVPLTAKIGTWFLGCALCGCVLGSVIEPEMERQLRNRKPASQRYQRGGSRFVRMNLKRRGGA